MNPFWVIVMAATIGPPNTPDDCAHITAAINTTIKVHAGPNARVVFKCQPYTGPLVPIPESAIPRPRIPYAPPPAIPYGPPVYGPELE